MNLAELRDSGLATISIEQAVEPGLLHLSRGLGYRLARKGELPGAIRLGRRWRVSVPALIRALERDTEAAR
ncbi:MAG: helix-turn-helix domain-containing protein [Actinomycetota bacterium]